MNIESSVHQNVSPSHEVRQQQQLTSTSRWQSVEMPAFPLPLCSAVPPKCPRRQLSNVSLGNAVLDAVMEPRGGKKGNSAKRTCGSDSNDTATKDCPLLAPKMDMRHTPESPQSDPYPSTQFFAHNKLSDLEALLEELKQTPPARFPQPLNHNRWRSLPSQVYYPSISEHDDDDHGKRYSI